MISYTTFSFFILYFGITWLVYSLVPQKVKWCVLLAGSYVFYFISSKGHIIPMIAATLIVWAVGLALQKLDKQCKIKRKQAEKAEKKAIRAKYNKYKGLVLWLGVILTAALLLVFKYSNFFIDTTNAIFKTQIAEVKIIQPLGLSFFILQAISYMADVYYGRIEAEKNPFRISLYLSFMLTVVEGPIARYGQLGTAHVRLGRASGRLFWLLRLRLSDWEIFGVSRTWLRSMAAVCSLSPTWYWLSRSALR